MNIKKLSHLFHTWSQAEPAKIEKVMFIITVAYGCYWGVILGLIGIIDLIYMG